MSASDFSRLYYITFHLKRPFSLGVKRSTITDVILDQVQDELRLCNSLFFHRASAVATNPLNNSSVEECLSSLHSYKAYQY